MNNDINQRIKKLGITKTFIAKQIGVSKSYITDLIAGRIHSYENMQKLKKLLDVYEEEIIEPGILT